MKHINLERYLIKMHVRNNIHKNSNHIKHGGLESRREVDTHLQIPCRYQGNLQITMTMKKNKELENYYKMTF